MIEYIKEGETEVAYWFRARKVVGFKLDRHELYFTQDAAMCSFILEDYELLEKFIANCRKVKAGLLTNDQLFNIEVN